MSARRIPRDALDLDTQALDSRLRGRRPRRVLLLGELAVIVRAQLVARGAEISDAADAHQAFELLASSDFDVVVVDPFASGNGLDLVSAIKESDAEHLHTVATLYGIRGTSGFLRGSRPPSPKTFDAARKRHWITPFIVLPVDGAAQYAIVVRPPEISFLEEPLRLPLVTAILSVDAARLIGTRAGLN